MSIIGIGTDMVHIARIAQTLSRFETRFVQRVFTPEEYQRAQQRGTTRRLAMFFAAKEAVAKALGTGFSGFAMKDIEVVYLASGKPTIRLHRQAKAVAQRQGVAHIHLSLSDDNGMAFAFAIAEQN